MKIFYYLITGIISLPKIFYFIIRFFLIGLFHALTILPRYFIIGIVNVINPKKASKIKINGKPIIPIMVISLSLAIYFIMIFIFMRWSIGQLKIKYLTNDIITTTDIIAEDTSNNMPPVDDTSNQSGTENNPDVYYPNDYWDYVNLPFINVNFDELKRKNSETVAWLKVNGTYINYPVVQHSDNHFYLKHDYTKNSNPNGWIYGDYRDNFNSYDYNTIIYGHNLNNRTLFGSLVWVLKSSWYSNYDNHIIKMSTPSNNTLWKVFSVYTIPSESYYLKTEFGDNNEYLDFLNNLKGRSVYDFGTPVTNNDKILTLSTCDDSGTKRVIVHAKMINITYR